MFTLEMLEKVAAGEIGVKAAVNHAAKGTTPAQATTRAGRKTGRPEGRPATGRKDPLLCKLAEQQKLAAQETLSDDDAARLISLTEELNRVRPSSRMCADPDEKDILCKDGRVGVRIKRQVIPQHVSQLYKAKAFKDDDRHDQDGQAYLTKKAVSYAERPRQYFNPQTVKVITVKGLPFCSTGRPQYAYPETKPGTLEMIGYREMSTHNVEYFPTVKLSVPRKPHLGASRPTLPDQWAHRPQNILEMVKAGIMTPAAAFDLLQRHPN